MNEQIRNMEKRTDKVADMFGLREKVRNSFKEIQDEYIHTESKNDAIYDLISFQSEVLSQDLMINFNHKGSTDNYELTDLIKPFICIGKKSLIIVINFGHQPKENQLNFFKAHYKIPINYKSKRLFYRHNKCTFSEETEYIFYTCKITNKKNMPFYSIISDDGYRLTGGKEMYKEFSSLFDFSLEFKNLDDFFGVNEVGIQKEIEARNDLIK